MHKHVTLIVGTKTLKMFVNIYRNRFNDVLVGTVPMEEFMEMEETLMEENENNMGRFGFLKVDDNTISLLVSYFLFSPLQVCFEGGNLGYTNLR
jgi:hypothetical protein